MWFIWHDGYDWFYGDKIGGTYDPENPTNIVNDLRWTADNYSNSSTPPLTGWGGDLSGATITQTSCGGGDPTTTTTTTAAPTTTTTTTTTTTAAPQALTFSALQTGCSPRWQLGNIPANTTSLRLTASGSHRGGTFSNVVFIIPIGTNSGTNDHKITGPTDNSYNLTIVHYGASLEVGSPAGSSVPGYFRTITRNDIYSYSLEHTFTANIEALDASNNVIK
jgi:hypothetical protein